MRHFIVASFCLGSVLLFAAATSEPSIEYKAQRYTRDMQTNTVTASGNAWVKKGTQEIWADELEIHNDSQRIIATGNVHIRDGTLEIWCQRTDYSLKGNDGILEEATLVQGQVILTGAIVKKLRPNYFESEDGTYSNCNLNLARGPGAGECGSDWKIYGRHFSVEIEGYVHIYDAILYIKNLPLFYTPYFVMPAKSERQSGFIMPTFSQFDRLGTGFSLPYFQVLGPWHDVTLTPTFFSQVGYHVGTDYRYTYDGGTTGEFKFFFTQRRFGDMPDPGIQDRSKSRRFGVIGEWAFSGRNVYSFWNRSQSHQVVRLVSNPYYTYDHGNDIGASGFPTLRSRASVTHPTDRFLFTGEVQYEQSMIVSKDSGVDAGAPIQLPTLTAAKTNGLLWDPFLSYEVDTHFTNFYRPSKFDKVPVDPKNQGLNLDNNSNFDTNDYLRTGQRLRIEPRLIANVPLSSGLQLQPLLRAGSMGYHFSVPTDQYLHREYVDMEVPLSLYLFKTYETGMSGFEKLAHVLQPRVIYSRSLYHNDEPDHPFFYHDQLTPSQILLSNPRFDFVDFNTPFEYFRMELINRFIRKSGDVKERFFLVQVSEQFNLKTSTIDPRYRTRLGPLELLSELRLGRLAFQTQAKYELQPNPNGQRAHAWSSALTYESESSDRLQLQTRFVTPTDIALASPRDATVRLSWYKTLPLFFNFGGKVEYSLKTADWISHELNFYFQSKPRACWGLDVTIGRDEDKQAYALISYRLVFGNPANVKSFTN